MIPNQGSLELRDLYNNESKEGVDKIIRGVDKIIRL